MGDSGSLDVGSNPTGATGVYMGIKNSRKKKATKGEQISIERATATVLNDIESQRLSRFTKTYLDYRDELKEEAKRNSQLKELLEGRESTKLTLLTKVHQLKRQTHLLSERTTVEILKTIHTNPSFYFENIDFLLKDTMARELKGIPLYMALNEKGREILRDELARHKLFDRIVSDSASRGYWIKRIMKERELKRYLKKL